MFENIIKDVKNINKILRLLLIWLIINNLLII